eukprot:Skav229660  [mRNA]  locus=scaffold1030:63779:64654:- [translate_table: standard]
MTWVEPIASVEDQGLLRVVLNGTFFTRDKQYHSGHFAAKTCPWCPSEDSIWHRHWECPHFKHEIAQVPPNIREQVQALPECTKLHGWMTASPLQHAFQHSLQTIPDMTKHIEPLHCVPSHLHLFVDGACKEPRHPLLRLAAWAVCVSDADYDKFWPIAGGGLSGTLQTILRAEITAAIVAVRVCVIHRRNGTIWTDSDIVYKRMCKLLRGDSPPLHSLQANHDLWWQLQDMVDTAARRRLQIDVAKVVSYLDEIHYGKEVDKWVIRGTSDERSMIISLLWDLKQCFTRKRS